MDKPKFAVKPYTVENLNMHHTMLVYVFISHWKISNQNLAFKVVTVVPKSASSAMAATRVSATNTGALSFTSVTCIATAATSDAVYVTIAIPYSNVA